LNILHLSYHNVFDLGYGKGRQSTYRLLKGLIQRGHRVWFLTGSRTFIGDDIKLKNEGIGMIRLGLPDFVVEKRFLWRISFIIYLIIYSVAMLIKALIISIRIRPDVVVSHSSPHDILPAFLLSKMLRVPYIFRGYGVKSFVNKSLLSLMTRIDLLFISLFQADLNVLTNDGTKFDSVAESIGIQKERIAFLVNGIDKKRIFSIDRKQMNRELNRMILSVCRLVGWKRVDTIIRAMPAVLSNYPDVTLYVIGDGPEKRRLEGLCNELNVWKNVRFLGSVSHDSIFSYLLHAYIFVSMNALSSISNPVIEAMAMGKPVIALNTGSTSDLVKHLENGILIEPDRGNEVEELSKYVLLLLHNESLCQKLGNAARDYILKEWPDWEDRVETEVALYEKLYHNCSMKRNQGISAAGKP